MRIRRKQRYQAIEPDEILLDAQNLPGFDATRLEGKLERPLERNTFRNFFIVVGLLGAVFMGQLVKLQVLEAETLKERSEANRLQQSIIISERGVIFDRNGELLALNTPQPDVGFSKRTYPLGEAASHVVGYVSYPRKDSNGFWTEMVTTGKFGIELIKDAELAGENGMEIKESSATGDVVSGSTIRVPQDGDDVTLSLDGALQEKLYSLIKTRALEASFVGGSGVIMDVHTGEVYALTSFPSFNPEVLAEGEEVELIEEYFGDLRAPLLDRAIAGLYTPGSVVKPFMALAALEENVISPEKSIFSSGSISIPNPYNSELPSVFRDWKAHGWTDMREALAVSSDVYFYAVGGGYEDQQGLGISAIEQWMRSFGFGEPTGIVLSGEEGGVIPNPKWKAENFEGERWFLGNTYHTAIGQYGFQVSPLQLARGIAAIANGGTVLTPLLEKDGRPKKEVLPIAPSSADVVREGMRLAVKEGTAAALNIPGVSVAAKTGTAEVGARKEFINSVIVGFFPADAPRFAFVVVMERARAGTTAGAPLVMRQLLEWMYVERPEMLDAVD
ncbi:MAG: penicillin-binding transpeptidase domain-containing protein [Patescibacteria group bacterium]